MDISQRIAGFSGDILILADTEYGPKGSYTSSAGATNAGATVTVGSTVGMAPGMVLSVSAGIGSFSPTARILSITNATTLVSTEAPLINLSGGAVVKGTWNIIPDWIICPSGISIVILEEYLNGVSTDILSKHGLQANQALDANYILKSSRNAGFSRLKITGGNANGFVLSPERARNNVDSVNSGIYYNG